MFCSECGKVLNFSDQFCPRCGSQVPARDVVRPQAAPTALSGQETACYCGACGQKMDPQDQFCMNCGWRSGSTVAPGSQQAQPAHAAFAAQPKKKTSKLKIWGIILLVLELLVVLGSMEDMAAMGIAELLGFLTPGIIGVILLIRDYNNKK